MAEKKQPNGLSSERQELEALKKTHTFTNPNNQIFARTQSTPLEDQKPLTSFKKTLKVSKAADFKPTGDSGLLSFLGPHHATTGTTVPFTSTAAPFIPAETKAPQTTATITAAPAQNIAKTTTAPQTKTTAPETTAQPTTKPAEGGSTPTSTGTAGTSSSKGSLKARLKLSSMNYDAKPFVPGGQPVTQIPATQPTTQPAVAPTQGEWGKPITKPVTETEKKNLPSPSKKNAFKLDLKAGQVQNKGLETIHESHAENKPAAVAKPEDTKESVENKKEVKPEAPKVEAKVAPKKEEQPKAEAPKPVAEQKAPAKVETQPEAKPEAPKVQEPKVEAKPEAEKKKEEKKPEEKPFGEPEKKEVKIEIVIMSRVDFAAAIARIGETLKERPLPENLEKIKNRQIILEKPSRGNYDKPKPQGGQPKPTMTMDRSQGQPQQPTPAGDGGFSRSEKKPEPVPEPKQTIVRLGLTEEEKKKKMELSSNVNVWVTKQKAVVDPEEAIKKEIKFNLNIITLDNFEIIKEKILDIASAKIDNCKKVAEFIIENAWTQKHYVNIYAKLCDFLGRSDRLNFDAKTDTKAKKKNDFKLHIMKQIQTVFEDESHANYGTKKTLEEMTPEEKTLFFLKKKQRILGNVSFIGELFLEKFIVIGIARIITNSLLQKYLEEYNVYQKAVEKPTNRSHEDTLEGLLKFIEIIGQTVEEKEATKAVDKQKSTAVVTNFQKILAIANTSTPSADPLPKVGNDDISLEDLFKIFNIILNESNLTTRLDSLIKNLVYRKDNKWQAPLSKNQGPKTMKEIAAEFEREQMEMERRADEYREELRDYQPRRGGNDKYGGGRTEVSFQVVKDNKNKKEEETKIDTSSIDVDTNISFRPVRGKGTQEAKEQPKKPRVNYEEIENALKDIYKLIGGETIEDKGTPQEELKKLVDKVGGKDVLRVYLKTFYDGRQDAVKKRLFVPNHFIENGVITGDEFLDQFENVMFKMYEIACDYPGVDNYFSILLLNYCKKTGDASPLNRISFSKDFYEGEEADYVLEFYHDFFRALLKNLEEEEFADMKNIIKEDDLKAFSDKLKIENFEDFRSNL